MNLSLQPLIGKLDEACRSALEAAAGLCLTRTNYDVDIEHLLVKLLALPDSDFASILRNYQVDSSRLARDLTRALDRLKTGNARTPALSPRLPRLIQEAWLLASVEQDSPKVRSGHLLVALLANEDLARLAGELSSEFDAISLESLRRDFAKITAGSSEARAVPGAAAAPADSRGGAVP